MRTFGVAECNRVSYGAPAFVFCPTYAISRAQPAHHWRDAPGRRRPSSGARGVEDAAPYGGCATNADACRVTGVRRVLHPTPGGRGSPPLRWVVAWDDGQRDCAAPTLHQPLSHGASRRDSSPFRGAEGWAEVCGVYAFVYRYADTFVSQPPVRGGVLDAPRLRDCRGGLGADVRHDQWHPCLPRCAQ